MSDDSSWHGRLLARMNFLNRPGRLPLFYFEDVLAAEFKSINLRRDKHARPHVAPLTPLASHHAFSPHAMRPVGIAQAPRAAPSRRLSPDPAKLFLRAEVPPDMASLARLPDRSDFVASGPGAIKSPEPPPAETREPEVELPEPPLDPNDPNYDKTRPQPVPCTVTGLAFSGGGIRSAAICLGALQALHARNIVPSIDYISTVSGGGYIGACLSAAMSIPGGSAFPFGDDVLDSSAVGHLRNYSNYLMPRGRSSVKNLADASAIILRGLLANVVIVLAAVLLCVVVSLVGGFLHWGCIARWGVVGLAAGAAAMLLLWAVLRSYARFDPYTDDTDSWVLWLARLLVIATFAAALVALQPIAIGLIGWLHQSFGDNLLTSVHFGTAVTGLGALSAAVSAWSGALGGFLRTSENAKNWTTLILRWGTQALVFVAALILPAAIWFARGCRRLSTGLRTSRSFTATSSYSALRRSFCSCCSRTVTRCIDFIAIA
jgi:Patatin-like phospholipase